MRFGLTIVERQRAPIQFLRAFFVAAAKANIAQIRVRNRKLGIELQRAHVERFRFVERRGIFVERARTRVELVRGFGATGRRSRAKHAHHVAAQCLDVEIQNELTRRRLELLAVRCAHDHAATVAHDFQFLKRPRDAGEGAPQRSNRFGDVTNADVFREHQRGAQRDQILERVRAFSAFFAARRHDLVFVQDAQTAFAQAEKLRDFFLRK